MEQQTNPSSCPSSPAAYVTAPNSPIDLDEFEFKNLSGHLHFDDPSKGFHDHGVPDRLRYRDRGDSLPAMAFADELFMNGLVMPLKLPPRLQESNKSPVTSPRTVCRLPFARKSSWNDDFDPFTVALEKVREGNRGRNSHHRRSRSYSPFRRRTTTDGSSDYNNNINHLDQDRPVEKAARVLAPSHSGPLDFKGSAYARWVRDQTREGMSPKISPRGFLFGKKVRPVKEQDSPDKPKSLKRKSAKNGSNDETNKVWKLKGFLLRFGRKTSGMKQAKMGADGRKAGYFGRVSSFKFKGKNKRTGAGHDHANMAMVEYQPSSASPFTLCLGRGSVVLGSPTTAGRKPK